MRKALFNHTNSVVIEKNSIFIIKSREKMWFYATVTKQLCLLDVCNSGEYFDILEGWLEILCDCLDMLHSGHESVATFSDGFLAILIHDGCKFSIFRRGFPRGNLDRESRVGILRWRCESVALRPSRGSIEITFVFARGNFSRSKTICIFALLCAISTFYYYLLDDYLSDLHA